jgi:hypothetical protein
MDRRHPPPRLRRPSCATSRAAARAAAAGPGRRPQRRHHRRHRQRPWSTTSPCPPARRFRCASPRRSTAPPPRPATSSPAQSPPTSSSTAWSSCPRAPRSPATWTPRRTPSTSRAVRCSPSRSPPSTTRASTSRCATEPYTKQGEGRGKNTAEKVGGGAAVGAILGGILGGGKGAAIGAAAGGGVGAGANTVTRGQQVQIESETVVRFKLSDPIIVHVTTGGASSGTPAPPSNGTTTSKPATRGSARNMDPGNRPVQASGSHESQLAHALVSRVESSATGKRSRTSETLIAPGACTGIPGSSSIRSSTQSNPQVLTVSRSRS